MNEIQNLHVKNKNWNHRSIGNEDVVNNGCENLMIDRFVASLHGLLQMKKKKHLEIYCIK